jgi:hypothetical protein
MSYEPSHRKPPPQERWPNATPNDGWPAYDSGSYGATPAYSRPATGYEAGTGSYPVAGDSYRSAGGWDNYGSAGGWDSSGSPGGWDSSGSPRGWDSSGNWDGYAGTEPGHEFPGPSGYPDDGYADQDEYRPVSSGAVLIAPDTMGQWLQRDQDEYEDADRDSSRGGPVVGAVSGFLAAAVAIGVATFAAAFVRPQASPIIAVGEAFIDRTPPALKNFAVEHFGENDKTILLGGMYVTIAGLALVLGFLARRNATVGVVGIAVFGLFGAFVALTRPESRASDVIPSVIGGLAGVAAFLWLARASAPVASPRASYSRGAPPGRAYGGRRRRIR